MDAAVIVGLLMIVGLFMLKNKLQTKTLEQQEIKLRTNDLELARKAKELNTDINTIKKELAEKETARKLTEKEIEEHWRNN